jgi:hypothetical protein
MSAGEPDAIEVANDRPVRGEQAGFDVLDIVAAAVLPDQRTSSAQMGRGMLGNRCCSIRGASEGLVAGVVGLAKAQMVLTGRRRISLRCCHICCHV